MRPNGTHLIVTIDGELEAGDGAVEEFLEELDLDVFNLGEPTGVPGVLADELCDEVKVIVRGELEPESGPVSLLDVFEQPQQLAATIQALVGQRPVVCIYQADDADAVFVRMAWSDCFWSV